MNVNLEVVSIPVSDVERALEFYRDRLGWRVDADIRGGGDVRVVQMTPTGEGHTSIVFGSGIPMAPAGTQRHSELVTSDIVATREELAQRGVNVTEVYHGQGSPFFPAARISGPTRTGPATTRTPRSRTRTETAGPSRRSPHAFRAVNPARDVGKGDRHG